MNYKKKKQISKHSLPSKKVQAGSFISNPKHQKFFLTVSIFVPAVIIISFFYSLYQYSINFPFFDDHEAILKFLNRYIVCDDISQRIGLLFEQHNEHRLVFDRLVALFEYYLFGKINFISFILIGHVALIVVLITLYKSFRIKQKFHVLYLLPIAAVIFNFRYFETSFWAMAALQNLWVLCFVFTSIYFLYSQIRYALLLSIFLGWMATFTSANGIMTFLAGSFVLLINKELFNKRNLIWLGAGVLAAVIYFHSYVKPAHHPSVFQPLFDNPIGFMGYVFAFMGGNFTENITGAVIIGIILALFVLFITYKKYYKENSIIYSFILFLLITSVVAALARFGFGIGQALSSKYAINSALLAVCCYIVLVSMLHRKIKFIYIIAITAVAIYFHFNTYARYLPLKKSEKEEFERNYAMVNQGRLSYFNYGWPPLDERKDLPKRELKTADSLGYFKFRFTEEAELIEKIPTDVTKEVKFQLDRFEQTQPNVIVISGWAFIKNVHSDNVIPIVCFKDTFGNPVKYFICRKYARPDVTQANASDNTNYNNSGFFVFFNPKEIKPGKYILAIIMTDEKYKAELNTGQLLNMQ